MMNMDRVARNIQKEVEAVLNRIATGYDAEGEAYPDGWLVTITALTKTATVDVAVKSFDLHRVQ